MNKTSGSLHITKKVDYGLFLLATLAKAKDKAHHSIKTISEESKISFPFLQKVARSLQQAGLIQAARGKYGGYSLKKDPKKISLGDVIEALDGPIALTGCLQKDPKKCKCKRFEFCLIRKGLAEVNTDIKNHFLSKPLAEIMN